MQEHTVYPYNNGAMFINHPGLTIRTRVEKSNGSFVATQSLSPPPSGGNYLDFGISSLNLNASDGRRYFIHLDLIDAFGSLLHTAKRRIYVKWPFDPERLVVTPTNNEGELQSARRVMSNSNDTLYIVSSNNDVTRDINFHLDWAGQRPESFVDYWDHAISDVSGEEPVYYFGASTSTPEIISIPLTTRRSGDLQVEYDSRFFPGAGIFNPDMGEVDINYYQAGVHLFGETHEVNLAFLRENRRTQALTLPDWLFFLEEKVNTFCNSAFDKIEAVMPIPLEIATSIETAASTTTFLTEYPESNHFRINEEESVGGTFGFNGNATWDLSPGPWLTIGPYVDVGLSVGIAYEHAKVRLHTENQNVTSAHTIEVPLEGRIALGAIIAFNLHGQDTTGINLSANVNSAFPVELKGKLQHNIDPQGTCLLFEANGGPASLNIAVNVGAQFDWGRSDIDINVFSYNWSYPVTDKYFLGPWFIKLKDSQDWGCN